MPTRTVLRTVLRTKPEVEDQFVFADQFRKTALGRRLWRWWLNLGGGGYFLVLPSGKFQVVRARDTRASVERAFARMKAVVDETRVLAVVWSAMSNDVYTHFVCWLRRAAQRPLLKAMERRRTMKELHAYMALHYKQIFAVEDFDARIQKRLQRVPKGSPRDCTNK